MGLILQGGGALGAYEYGAVQRLNERMTEISYESRFLVHHADADGSLAPFTNMLEAIERDLPPDSSVRATESFHQLFRLRALKNLR